MLLVAFDSDVYTVKNSWGKDWGEDGYVRLSIGGTAGMWNDASYPIIESV